MKNQKIKKNKMLLSLMTPVILAIAPPPIAIMPNPFYSIASFVRMVLKWSLLIYLVIIIPTSFVWRSLKKEKYLNFYKSKLFLALSLVFALAIIALFCVLFFSINNQY
jgi:hypothetical protein